MGVHLRVASINCRNTKDRWSERRPLLVRQLRELDADLVGLQELRRWPSQGRSLRNAAGADRPMRERYSFHGAQKHGIFVSKWEGIGALSRLEVVDREVLSLGLQRVALRLTVLLANGAPLDFYTTHLHHDWRKSDIRVAQARLLSEWMAARAYPAILTGDFNARPETPEMQLFFRSLRSAHLLANGHEPQRTFPAPVAASWPGHDAVLDYILVSEGIRVYRASLAFTETAPGDDRLSASDHYGLVAELEIG